MAIPLLPILKTLPTIVAAVREVTGSVKERRASGTVLQIEERTKKLEDDLVKAGTALADLATQVQAIAEELRAQAAMVAAERREVVRLRWITLTAGVTAIGAVIIPLMTR